MTHVIIPTSFVALTLVMMYVSGANDGGALLAMPARLPGSNVISFAAILAVSIIIGPLLMVSVAKTLVSGLFNISSPNGSGAFFIGTLTALVTVLVLTKYGLPTSLTLALVGGITGAGAGAGVEVEWASVIRVLTIGLCAPILGSLLGALFYRLSFLPPSRSGRQISSSNLLHNAVFALVSLAYAVNDGQKMLAIATVALLTLPHGVNILEPNSILLLFFTGIIAAAVFVLGLFARIRKVGIRLGLDLAIVRPTDALSSQIAAATAVLTSSALGAPVSMTQSLSGGIIGTAISRGAHRVRWTSVFKMLGAWVITLPTAGVISFLLAAVNQ